MGFWSSRDAKLPGLYRLSAADLSKAEDDAARLNALPEEYCACRLAATSPALSHAVPTTTEVNDSTSIGHIPDLPFVLNVYMAPFCDREGPGHGLHRPRDVERRCRKSAVRRRLVCRLDLPWWAPLK